MLYADQRGIFDKLTTEQAGQLIKHIFSYINDEGPEGDFITELAFESIKQQLKRDLVKWNNRAERSRLNGSLGGRPKKPKETQKTQQVKKEPRKPDTVNVTVTGNDNVKVNDNVIKQKGVVYPFDSDLFKRHWLLWLDYKAKEFNFKYKTIQSEQAALKKLAELSNQTEGAAIKIIEQSFANGWKGFFELKNNKDEQRKLDRARIGKQYYDRHQEWVQNGG